MAKFDKLKYCNLHKKGSLYKVKKIKYITFHRVVTRAKNKFDRLTKPNESDGEETLDKALCAKRKHMHTYLEKLSKYCLYKVQLYTKSLVEIETQIIDMETLLCKRRFSYGNVERYLYRKVHNFNIN